MMRECRINGSLICKIQVILEKESVPCHTRVCHFEPDSIPLQLLVIGFKELMIKHLPLFFKAGISIAMSARCVRN
jgi:hypothetical protein